MYRAYSNDLVGQEPQTPVYLAKPGQEIRLRVTSPAGYARNTVLGIFGHNWTQEPFVTRNFPSDTMAWSETQRFMSSQDNIMPPNAWNIMTEAGGPFEVPGDYLYRDLASFGNLNGLWGILRVEEDAVPATTPAP
jgi:hypothetical protein